MLSEFLFGSLESPIKDVTIDGPIYNEDPSKEELFKMGVSDEITKGALACAKALRDEGLPIAPDGWVEYVTLFMNNLTDEDRRELKQARNAGDVEQKYFNSVMWTPYKKVQFWAEKWGRATYYFYLILFKHKFRLKIGRGIGLEHTNMVYKEKVIER